MPARELQQLIGRFVVSPAYMRLCMIYQSLPRDDFELTPDELIGVNSTLTQINNPPGDPLEVAGEFARLLTTKFPELGINHIFSGDDYRRTID